MCYTLPKIWMGRIQKYWDRIIPSDYPVSGSSFSTKFKSDEAAVAVEKMENEINSENCIAINAIPENTYVSKYVGTYEVDGTPGELTLLSPEKVNSDNVVVMHLNDETGEWEKVEDIQIIDGYVWGTVEKFSPFAVFEFKTNIVVTDDDIEGIETDVTKVIANGNTVTVFEDEDGKVFVKGGSGDPIELTKKTFIFGGSVDGTPIKHTNVNVIGVKNSAIVYRVYAGSYYFNKEAATTVEDANVKVIDSVVKSCSGSLGSVRTNKVTVSTKGSKFDFLGCGESYIAPKRVDMNKKNCSFGSLAWVKEAVLNVEDCTTMCLYLGGGSGFLYVHETKGFVHGGKTQYLITGGSNGATKTAELAVDKNAVVDILQFVNRGEVDYASAKLVNTNVDKLFIAGDATDNSVDGTVNKLRVEINAGEGEYNVQLGTIGGATITDSECVEAFKVSRNANVFISDDIINLLGGKYIVK